MPDNGRRPADAGRTSFGDRLARAVTHGWGPATLAAAALAVFLTLVLGSAARAAREEAFEDWTGRLASMADDRTASIQRWLDDLRADAVQFARYPSVIAELGGPRTTPLAFRAPGDRHRHLSSILADALDHPGRVDLWVFDPAGDLVAAGRAATPAPDVVRLAREAGGSPAGRVITYHSDDGMRVAVSVPVTAPGSAPLGVVIVEERAADFLVPLLLAEPVRTESAEAILVTRVGDSLHFISPVRKRAPGQGDIWIPASSKGLAANSALRGERRAGIFRDYAGDVVLAVTRTVAGVPWGLVVKVDRREVLAEQRRDLLMLALGLVGILMGGLGVTYGLWKQASAAAQRTVREREERFRWHAERAGDLIYRYRLLPDRGFEFVNRAVTALTGFTPDEHYADPDLAYRATHPEDRPLLREAMRGTGASDEPSLLMRYIRKDGSVVWIEQRITLVRDAAGAIVAAEGIGREVTDRKEIERQLIDARDRLQLALSVSRQTIFDADTRSGRVLVSTSKAGDGRLGIHNDILTFEEATLALHPEDRERVVAGFTGLATGSEESFESEYRIRDGAGRFRWVRATARVVERDDHGGALRIVGLYADITARRLAEAGLEESRERYSALEQQMRQAQKMEAVGRLAGGIAHDFNNVLTAIRGNALIALEDLPPTWSARTDIEHVVRDADRAAALTRQLLAFSRNQVMELRVFDLCEVLAGMEPLMRRLIGEDVHLIIDGAGPCWIRADPAQLEQVILNLAVNARDAMPTGGRLTMSAGTTPVTDGDGAEAILRVRDTGIGMDAATVERIFEPFFTTKEVGKGTGLGLSTAYGIVRQCGGSIRVDSAVGVGTTFTLAFPTASPELSVAPAGPGVPVSCPAPPVRDPAAPLARKQPDSRRILIVEDEGGVRELARRVLQRQGYTVLAAASPEEAVRLAAGEPPHLLITDVVLPGMSGPDLARRIARTRPALRVILMSGYPEAVIRGEHRLPAGGRFLEKPFTPADLLAAVAAALSPGTARIA